MVTYRFDLVPFQRRGSEEESSEAKDEIDNNYRWHDPMFPSPIRYWMTEYWLIHTHLCFFIELFEAIHLRRPSERTKHSTIQ